jgi:hypothetical protein
MRTYTANNSYLENLINLIKKIIKLKLKSFFFLYPIDFLTFEFFFLNGGWGNVFFSF